MIGTTWGNSDVLGDFYFCKMKLDSDTIFTINFGNYGKSSGRDLIQYITGDYVIVGAETFSTNIYTESYIRCINSNGNYYWDYSYFASNEDESWMSVAKSKLGTPSVSYLRNVPVPGFNLQGNIFLNHTNGVFPDLVNSFGGTEDETLYKNCGVNDGGYISVGSTNSFNSSNKNIFFIKLDSNIINYVSIVDLPEKIDSRSVSPYRIKRNSNVLSISFSEHKFYKLIQIESINGKILHEFKYQDLEINFDLTKIQERVFILKIISNTDELFIHKLLNETE